MFLRLLSIYLGVELLDYMVTKFNFLRKCQTVFHSGCTILHSHQQYMRVLIPPYPQKHLSFSVCFSIIDTLMSVGCYLTVTLLMTFFNLFFIEVPLNKMPFFFF